jgi:hypothetical protein
MFFALLNTGGSKFLSFGYYAVLSLVYPIESVLFKAISPSATSTPIFRTDVEDENGNSGLKGYSNNSSHHNHFRHHVFWARPTCLPKKAELWLARMYVV